MRNRDPPRFFDQVGHQTTNASIENKHFFHKIRTLPKLWTALSKIAKFALSVIFQCLKLVKSFPKKISVKNI